MTARVVPMRHSWTSLGAGPHCSRTYRLLGLMRTFPTKLEDDMSPPSAQAFLQSDEARGLEEYVARAARKWMSTENR